MEIKRKYFQEEGGATSKLRCQVEKCQGIWQMEFMDKNSFSSVVGKLWVDGAEKVSESGHTAHSSPRRLAVQSR